jgi:hypothetical protein
MRAKFAASVPEKTSTGAATFCHPASIAERLSS